MKDASEDDILDLALLISQLKDIDLLSDDCVPLAFEEIRKQATELKAIEPKENIWSTPWKRASNFESVEDCQHADEDEYDEEGRGRERRLQRAERLENAIRSCASNIDYAIGHSKTDACTHKPYSRLWNSNEINYMREDCETIKTRTDGAYNWCFQLANAKEEELKDAAKELIERCPPEPTILELEPDVYDGYIPHEIIRIKDICALAEDEECLDIIRQVEARAAAGIEAKKLPFEDE